MKSIFTSIFILFSLITFVKCKPSPKTPVSQNITTPVETKTPTLSSIAVDTFEVTVEEFGKFIEATKYETTADSFGWSGVWNIEQGSWDVAEKANWLMHDGMNEADPDMPVVHVSYRDACAYCAWKDGRLPSAQEWDLLAGDTVIVGNVWQGLFPRIDEGLDGYKTISAPVGKFAPNTNGLYDVFGNVWEWTSTMDTRKNERIIKGGSFLCDYNVCQGYIPARYQTTPDDSGLNHLGIRCVYDL